MENNSENPSKENITSISISDEMKKSYLDYAMSVIVSRALPDVRDGLKPVHRRVLFGMHELGIKSNTAYISPVKIPWTVSLYSVILGWSYIILQA